MLQVAEKQPDLVPELAEFFLAHGDFKSSQQLLALSQGKQPATDRSPGRSRAYPRLDWGQLDEAQKTLEGVLERTPESLDALVAAAHVGQPTIRLDCVSGGVLLVPPNLPLTVRTFYTGWCQRSCTGITLTAPLANAQKLHTLVPE